MSQLGMRIASLQPSVSVTLDHLNALDSLCAVTKYCVAAVPALATRRLPILHDSWSFGEADQVTLARAQPDLVIASVPYRPETLAAILKSGVPVLALAPRTLADVCQDILLIARQVDALPRAEELVHRFRTAVGTIRAATSSAPAQTVYCEEWGKPLIHSQPWVAELIAAANGRFVGTPGAQTMPETVAGADPDVLLFAWCGAGNRVPLERILEQRNWKNLRAVRAGRVFCIPDETLNTPSFNLLEGLHAIASLLHPDRFPQVPGVTRLRP